LHEQHRINAVMHARFNQHRDNATFLLICMTLIAQADGRARDRLGEIKAL